MISEVFQTEMGNVYHWLLAVSNALASRFGARWSTEWAQAGFVKGSTGIPTLVLSLVTFFTKNPRYEVPTMDQTAAFGTTLEADALAKQKVALWTAGDDWTKAHETLAEAMRGLI